MWRLPALFIALLLLVHHTTPTSKMVPSPFPPVVVELMTAAKNEHGVTRWMDLPKAVSIQLMNDCLQNWPGKPSETKKATDSLRRKFNNLANPERYLAQLQSEKDKLLGETAEEKAARCARKRSAPSQKRAVQRKKARRDGGEAHQAAVAERRSKRHKWESENRAEHKANLEERRSKRHKWESENPKAYREYLDQCNAYDRIQYREMRQEQVAALNLATGSTDWPDAQVLFDLPEVPDGEPSWQGVDDLRNTVGALPALHISNVGPVGHDGGHGTLRQFRQGNRQGNPWLPINTIVPPSMIWGPSWSHSRNGRRRRRKAVIDGSWWGLTVAAAFKFAEENGGREWISQRQTLFLYVCQVNNDNYWAINQMGGGIQPWYMHSIIPVTPDHCYKLVPLPTGGYAVTQLY